MKPCPKCGEQPTVSVYAPRWFEFVGRVTIGCCDHHVCADDMTGAIEAWEQEPNITHIGEITSL